MKVDDDWLSEDQKTFKGFTRKQHDEGNGFSRDDGEDDDKKLISRKVSHGAHLVRGKMDHGMEDYIVAETRLVNSYELGCLQSLMAIQPDFWTDPKKATKRAYKATDDEILEKVASSRGGSIAVTAILINGEMLIVANVGDSRAVLCRDGVAKQITVDHDPQKEKELVESRGGCVVKRPVMVAAHFALMMIMSLSAPLHINFRHYRADGDDKLKEHITSEPDYQHQEDWQVMVCGK